MTEDHLCDLYGIFAAEHVKINSTQISAISTSVCFDADERRFPKLITALESKFKLRYNTGLQLITVRHFNKDVIAKLTESKTVLLEQLSRHTAQLVVREV